MKLRYKGGNNMFNNKYSKLLTIILVVVIIAIVGLLAFFAYDVYRKNTIESESQDAVSRFEEELNKIINTTDVVETQTNTSLGELNTDVVTPGIDINAILDNTTTDNGNNSNTTSSNNNSSGSTTKYKGYDWNN